MLANVDIIRLICTLAKHLGYCVHYVFLLLIFRPFLDKITLTTDV